MPIVWEPIGAGLAVPTDAHCRFTEDAVHLAAFAAPNTSDIVCDLGAGCGILPLLWCRWHPPAHITAVEREAAFVSLLREAVDRFTLDKHLSVIQADWRDSDALPPEGSMTLVTCNPPYFPFGASRAGQDPLRTAARHEDHPDLLVTLCRAAARLLCDTGRFCLCHRPSRVDDVLAALRAAGLTATRMQFVQSTVEAAPFLVLIEAAFSETLQVLPTKILQKQGTHTAVYKRLYRKTLANRHG